MNKIILSFIIAALGAQLLKLPILWIKKKKITWYDLIASGGMPSSHSAFVISLTTAVYLAEGISTAFIISLALAFIILRDSFGVRRTVGYEAEDLKKLLKKHKMKPKKHYAMGHTPVEVLVGSVFGLVVSLIIYLI